MPDFWTHIIGGELILEELKDKKWQEMINNNKEIFNFGCQGPDFFFYNDFWPWIQNRRGPEAGRLLHKKNINAFFLESIDYLKDTEADYSKLATYLIGFIAHYAIDKTCHPFIYNRSNTYEEHKYLEINLDTYLIKEMWHKDAYKLSPAKAIDIDRRIPEVIETFYKKLLLSTHNYQKELDLINDSYLDLKKFMALFHCPYRIKSLFFKLISPLSPLATAIFIYPTKINYQLLSKEDYLKFKSLLYQGVREGIKLIKLIDDYLQEKITKEQLQDLFPTITFDGEEANL